MTRRWFIMLAILGVAAIAVFVTDQATQAQRPDRGEMRQRPGGGRQGGGMRGFSPTSIIDGSWTDLTFAVKVNDDTLIKARPVYQKSRDDLEAAVKEARDAGDFQAMREVMTGIREEFKASLGKVLTEAQIAQLDELEQQRMQQQSQRRGGRPGGGGRPGRGER